MTNSDTNQPLSEAERFAYLQAMDVPIWVSRSQVEDSESNSLTPAEGNPAEEMVSLKEPATQQATTLDSLEAHQEADNQEALTEESTADEHSQDSFEAATVSSDSLSAEDSVEDQT